MKKKQFNDNRDFVESSFQPVHNDTKKNYGVNLKFILKTELTNLKMKIFQEVSIKMNGAYPKTRYNLVNQTVDFCSFLRKPTSNWQVAVYLKGIENYPGFPTKCPIEPKLYVINNFTVDTSIFPKQIFPDTRFFSLVNFFTIIRKRPVILTWMKTESELLSNE